MEVESIRKTFRLIEPLLPKKVVSDFQKFIDEAVEVKEMYRYNSQMLEMLQDSIRVLGEKLDRKEMEERQQKEENLQLMEELNQVLQQKYELEKQIQNVNKQRLHLQKKVQVMEKMLKDERKNYLILINKTVKDNELLLSEIQKLNQRLKQSVPLSKYQEKEKEVEWLTKENEELQMEYEAYRERYSYAFQTGFHKAILYERKRKR